MSFLKKLIENIIDLIIELWNEILNIRIFPQKSINGCKLGDRVICIIRYGSHIKRKIGVIKAFELDDKRIYKIYFTDGGVLYTFELKDNCSLEKAPPKKDYYPDWL